MALCHWNTGSKIAGQVALPHRNIHPHETKVMLTEDILHDLQKENIVFQKEYTRQIYDTNAFLSTGSCLKDSSVIYIKIKKENPCVKGESYG